MEEELIDITTGYLSLIEDNVPENEILLNSTEELDEYRNKAGIVNKYKKYIVQAIKQITGKDYKITASYKQFNEDSGIYQQSITLK